MPSFFAELRGFSAEDMILLGKCLDAEPAIQFDTCEIRLTKV